ncbi:MAG: UDP-N-acetylmuramoyl-tripeptide--D-alanyl-D-alanine ligase [Dermatophilaceae bacterium]
MIALSLAQVAELTGGEIHGERSAAAVLVDGPVVTDSRAAGPGSLYVARIGEHADGHEFVGAAAQRGAVAALTSRPVGALPCVVVADVQGAFGALARGVLDRAPAVTVIAITGSSGKTSTKDLLAQVLARAGPAIAPVDSLNGEVGVPLTVCRITEQTRFLVAEMGSRGVGHLRYLTGIAPPDLAVVLNVGTAHVGQFGSREVIAVAKRELVEALRPEGVAVLNADDPAVAAMAEHTRGRVVLVGESPQAQVRATDVRLDAQGRPSLRAVTPAGSAPVTLALHGRHHVGNALAVLAVALECGMPLGQVADALADSGPVSRWRMEVTERPDGVTVVNDAYNANPDSMLAALAALAAMGHPDLGPTRRTWAVLGEMLELGPQAEPAHRRIGRRAADLHTDLVVAVGPGAAGIAHGALEAGIEASQATSVPDADAAYRLLAAELRPGDVVLFKSSRDAGLRWLAERVAAAEGAS